MQTQNMYELAEHLKQLREEKKNAEQRLKEMNAEIEQADYQLSMLMAETETQNFTRAGTMFALTTKGSNVLTETQFQAGDWFVFGSETAGLPDAVRDFFPSTQRIRLPMMPNNRSLNLSNTTAIIVYEAWRQCGFAGGA